MNYSEYKRVFAFGCSFTSWRYPTWADIIAKCCDNAEFTNLGRGGGGNLFIASQITQANIKFHFNRDDLLLVMFSTPYREDRWIDGRWILHGNIYNQPFYPKSFVKNFVDPVGLLIRDLTVMETTYAYINSLPCDNFVLRACDQRAPEFLNENDEHYERLSELYARTSLNKLPMALYPGIIGEPWARPFVYRNGDTGMDNHPLPKDYLDYLRYINIPLTDEAIQYATDSNRRVMKVKYEDDLESLFPIANYKDVSEMYGLF